MRYAHIDGNDYINGEGICVSFWTQGCVIRCPGCHNSDIWDFNGGVSEQYEDVCKKISDALTANGVHRNFSILGGEPLAPQNIYFTNLIGYYVQINHPDSKIFLWTGYTKEQLEEMGEEYTYCFKWADVIIDGPYKQELRDVRLHLRGSSNQRILKKGVDY